MKIRHLLAVFVACTLFSSAHAGQAEICYGPSSSLLTANPPTNATVFQCPITGARTLPQLAAAGWQITQLVPIVTDSANSLGADQIVIQKP